MRLKGFVLTTDAVFALGIALTSAFILTHVPSANALRTDMQQLATVGNDLLSVLQHNKTFNNYIGASETQVTSDMLSRLAILPAQYCANMTVTIYDADNFNSKSYTAATCSKHGDISKTKRIFADYVKKKFGIVELELWLR